MKVFHDHGVIKGVSKNPEEFNYPYIESDVGHDIMSGKINPDEYQVYDGRVLRKDYIEKRKKFNDILDRTDKENGTTTLMTRMTLKEISDRYQPRGFVEWRLDNMVKEIFPHGNNIVNLSDIYQKKQRIAELYYTIYTLSLVEGDFESPISVFYPKTGKPMIHPGGTRTAFKDSHDEQLDVILVFYDSIDDSLETYHPREFYCKHYDMDIVYREADDQFHEHMVKNYGPKYRVVYGEFNTNRSVVYTEKKDNIVITMENNVIYSNDRKFLQFRDDKWEIVNVTRDGTSSS